LALYGDVLVIAAEVTRHAFLSRLCAAAKEIARRFGIVIDVFAVLASHAPIGVQHAVVEGPIGPTRNVILGIQVTEESTNGCSFAYDS
jgi:hypothetical protein